MGVRGVFTLIAGTPVRCPYFGFLDAVRGIGNFLLREPMTSDLEPSIGVASDFRKVCTELISNALF